MKLHILNGPNLNLLGKREPDIYGNVTLKELETRIIDFAKLKESDFNGGIEVVFRQTNNEGDFVSWLNDIFMEEEEAAVIINPAAWTHTSIAISDALAMFKSRSNVKIAEVHISNINNREDFRKVNFISQHVFKTISGEGVDGYLHAIDEIFNAILD